MGKEKKRSKQEANMRFGRRPGPEDKVAVCWYDQSSYDASSRWANIRTSQRDQTEVKKTRGGQRQRDATTNEKRAENEQSYV